MYLAHPFTLGAGLVFLVAGIVLYRRRGREDKQHGSQGAVILLIIGAIMAIHGLGLLEYRPAGIAG
jgi:uncharacterized membrane protein